MVPNPEYKGEWKPKKIENPDYMVSSLDVCDSNKKDSDIKQLRCMAHDFREFGRLQRSTTLISLMMISSMFMRALSMSVWSCGK